MSARQLIVLAVAFIAAIGAMVVIRGMTARPPERREHAAPIEGQQVLVVTRNVMQGAALTGSDLAWRLFPNDSVGGDFIRQSQRPDASTELQGAIARRNFSQGEPVIEGSLVLANGHGFLAAQLQPGYRAVAVEIESTRAVGGFIQPNDHVDVVMTAKTDGESGGHQVAHATTILQDVRVLALDEHVQTQTTGDAPERAEARVAVLELSAADARLLAQADMQGEISLSLRGVQTEPANLRVPSAAPPGSGTGQGGGGVLIHAFGQVRGTSR